MVMTDVTPDAVNDMLDFLYCRPLMKGGQSDFLKLLTLADRYQIRSLEEMCLTEIDRQNRNRGFLWENVQVGIQAEP